MWILSYLLFCSKECFKEKIKGFLTAFVLLQISCSIITSQTCATDLALRLTLPLTNDDSLDCNLVYEGTIPHIIPDPPGSPLTDLTKINVYGWRFGDADTILIGEIPTGGYNPGDSLLFTLDITPGTMGIVYATAVDLSNNESCIYSTYLFATEASESVSGLVGDYYDNFDLTGYKFTRADTTINFSWGTGSPDSRLAVDTYSVKWNGIIRIPIYDTYTFTIETDDGVRLKIDNTMVIDSWIDQVATLTGQMVLQSGSYPINIEWYENGGAAFVRLYWQTATLPKQIIPAIAFSH